METSCSTPSSLADGRDLLACRNGGLFLFLQVSSSSAFRVRGKAPPVFLPFPQTEGDADVMVFFLFRILISLIFVLIVPIGVLLSVENLPLRILLASLSAAPAYSYVKMATFKFFLEVYRPYPEIRREYPEYFEALPN